MLVREEELDLARGLVGPAVELVAAPLDDLVGGNGTRAGIDFNFNGWGGKQDFARDAGVADIVTGNAGVESLPTDLILEGGGIEVDGEGTAIITGSCVLNNNRNPGWSKADVEAELRPPLGLDKIIWLPGIAGKDITDGHTDFYARFARPGVVVAGYDPDPESFDHDVTTRHLEIFESAVDAQGPPTRSRGTRGAGFRPPRVAAIPSFVAARSPNPSSGSPRRTHRGTRSRGSSASGTSPSSRGWLRPSASSLTSTPPTGTGPCTWRRHRVSA